MSNKTTSEIVNDSVIESKIGWDFKLGVDIKERWIKEHRVREAIDVVHPKCECDVLHELYSMRDELCFRCSLLKILKLDKQDKGDFSG